MNGKVVLNRGKPEDLPVFPSVFIRHFGEVSFGISISILTFLFIGAINFYLGMKFFLFFLGFLFLACKQPVTDNCSRIDKSTNKVKYAKGFAWNEYKDYSYVEVYNPWNKSQILAKYIFASDTSGFPDFDGHKIPVPVQKGVFLSSTYIGMLAMLDARNVVLASNSANLIYDSAMYQNYLNGKIVNLGSDMTINAEAIIGLNPDVVVKYIYLAEDQSDKFIDDAGIPIIYIIEFMEEHPLGRTEWIKLLGLVTGKQALSDSVFSKIEADYLSYCELAKTATETPSVLLGNNYKGTWYTAGGKSFVAQLIKDANASYYWSSDSSTGSIPLSFEVVLQKQYNAQFWLNAEATSLNDILQTELRCNAFESFKNGRVYHYNKRMNPEGGSDYYESGVMNPQLLLHDFISIFHPTLMKGKDELYYYLKLE